ncbi:Antigenic thaumatin-like protein [Penicillium hispanicum]|uniref:Antigenic thaumatin-like protein n=1 Tax=Penicillium hispanicum TaxID=1080232 RepID=UPI00253FBE76|nr:Antigenic thaumatin-like protein [Penicillium hispanicum]KAJ5595165.1 Antigenic thaumatin-like protein [Penicillium hispanicum]
MKSSSLVTSLIAALGLAHPTVQTTKDTADPIPWGAFSVPSSSPSPSAPSPSSASSQAAPLGRAIIDNHCQTPIYVWSVGSEVKPEATVLPSGRYFETFRADTKTGGIALKLSTVPDCLYQSAPQTILAYSLINGTEVWYDVSDVFGDPFKGHPVALQPSDPEILWSNGVPPAGSQVRAHDASTDLVLTVC